VASPNLRVPAFPNYSTSNVYRVTELIGTSESSWEDAAKHAVETAAKTLRDLRVAEVNKLDLMIVDAKSPLSARG